MQPDDLRRAIKFSGLTIYRISKMSGVSHVVIARFVRQERDVMFSTACKIATALGLAITSVR